MTSTFTTTKVWVVTEYRGETSEVISQAFYDNEVAAKQHRGLVEMGTKRSAKTVKVEVGTVRSEVPEWVSDPFVGLS